MTKVDLHSVKEQYKINRTGKVYIHGVNMSVDIYRIPIDLLHYNNQSDKAVILFSKYDFNSGKNISDLSVQERDELIEKYIINSDDKGFLRLKDNIKKIGQMEPGVILENGCVIDGNRRFTCLRELYRETGDQQFNFFETVILELNKDITEKQIRKAELQVSNRVMYGKVDYHNPIEKLVGVYRDIVKNKFFGKTEFARLSGLKKSVVEKSVELAKLMEDFLEYINKPEAFYIAEELEIDGPLNEVYRIKKKIGSDAETWANARIVLYDMILTHNGKSDLVRTIREFGKNYLDANTGFVDDWQEITASKKIRNKLISDGYELDGLDSKSKLD